MGQDEESTKNIGHKIKKGAEFIGHGIKENTELAEHETGMHEIKKDVQNAGHDATNGSKSALNKLKKAI
jgi:hypothetical protein